MDIIKQKLHRLDLEKGPSSLQTWDLDTSIGTTADIEGSADEFIFGGKLGYGIFDQKTGTQRYIKKYDWAVDTPESEMRGNDGSVDSHGRFWVGAMNDPLVKPFSDVGKRYRTKT